MRHDFEEEDKMKAGKWIRDDYGYYHCSLCGYEHDEPEYTTAYCPGCDAYMSAEVEGREFRPPTNFEKIQNMDLNEMADFLSYFDINEVICRRVNPEMGVSFCSTHTCSECAREYLESEMEE